MRRSPRWVPRVTAVVVMTSACASDADTTSEPARATSTAVPGRLLAIGPTFEFEDAIAVDADAHSVAPGFDSVWIAHANDGTVMRFAADAFDVSDEAS